MADVCRDGPRQSPTAAVVAPPDGTGYTPSTDRQAAGVVLEGTFQSCDGSDGYGERIYDALTRPMWEFHLGPKDEFALFRGVLPDHRAHDGADNLLQPWSIWDDGTHRNGQRWRVPSLRLEIEVKRIGVSRDECRGWYVTVRTR